MRNIHRVAGGVLKTRMLGPHLKLTWDLLETGCSSPWIPAHSQARGILGGGKPRVRRQNAWVSHLPDSRLSWSCYEAERSWVSGSPFITGGKATFQKKSRLDTHCNNFTPANFSLFRDVFRQNFLRIERMTHREFSNLWTGALKVFAPEWCSSCVEQEGQDEKVVMWFEMLLEGTPEKCLSYAQTCWGLWNYILRDSLLWVFQGFQLNYGDFWKGLCLYLDLLKLYQIVFPVNSSLGVSFEERSHKKKPGEQG